MTRERNKARLDLNIFRLLVALLTVSFFDESRISILSAVSLVATLLIPIVILIWYKNCRIRLTREDKKIAAAFIVFMSIQILNIRLNDIYTSITPIYRSVAVLLIVLYIRKFNLTKRKYKVLTHMSFVTIILGFLTIFNRIGKSTNLLYGNYNTVGVLYFTIGVVNILLYIKLHNRASLFAFLGCLGLILLSNTRTALILLVIMFVVWFVLNMLPKSIKRPKIINPVFFIIIIAFVWFYYHIKELSLYSVLNDISKMIFNKNFDSGRPDLWKKTVSVVGSHWLLGRGTGIDLENFVYYLKTPHSVYFDIYLQNGWLGLTAYLICIIVAVKQKGKWYYNIFNTAIVTLVFVILFYNSVGIVFTKARSGIGLIQWALLALPYSESKRMEVKIKRYDKPCRSGI